MTKWIVYENFINRFTALEDMFHWVQERGNEAARLMEDTVLEYVGVNRIAVPYVGYDRFWVNDENSTEIRFYAEDFEGREVQSDWFINTKKYFSDDVLQPEDFKKA